MEQLGMPNEKAVVLFSGGFDSTLVLADLVKHASDTDTIYAVTIEHNITGTQKLRREYESQLLILRELRKQFPKVRIEHERISIESNWTVGDATNSKGLAQPIFWMCNLIPFLENNDNVYFGYNLNDQARVHIDHIKELFKVACKFQSDKHIEPKFPISYLDKTEVLRSLMGDYPYLIDHCITCESMTYDGTNVCGDCVPCTHLKQALFNISLEPNDYGKKAKEMLKERFHCTVDVHYDWEDDAVKYIEPVYPDTECKYVDGKKYSDEASNDCAIEVCAIEDDEYASM